MRMCQPHWDQMRQAVDDRGMSHLVARSAEEAAANAAAELQGSADQSNWDPLMAMNWNLFEAALKCGGLSVMGVDENGEQYCPLCLAKKHGEVPDQDQLWLGDCADAMQRHAMEVGLIPGRQ